MIDSLDARIRSAVVQIVDAGPPPPTYYEITAMALQLETRRRSRASSLRRIRLVAGAMAITASAVLGGLWVSGGSSDHSIKAAGSQQEQPAVPVGIVGMEQTLAPVSMPEDFSDVWRASRRFASVVPGTTPESYSVNGTTPFAIADLIQQTNAPVAPWLSVNLLTRGTLPIGGQGLGTQGFPIPYSDLAAGKPATFTAWDTPVPHEWLMVWTRLPSGTAFVSLSYDTTRLWERIKGATAAFVFDIPLEMRNVPASPTDPLPHFVAYSSSGAVLGEATGTNGP